MVCVTGNNGKTTTKEMVAAVLRTRFRMHATRANNNNLVGVPLTILEAPEDVEALVIEGGGNVPGELPRYREIIEPDDHGGHQRDRRPPRGVRHAEPRSSPTPSR